LLCFVRERVGGDGVAIVQALGLPNCIKAWATLSMAIDGPAKAVSTSNLVGNYQETGPTGKAPPVGVQTATTMVVPRV
jgi:hypothetical protein